MTRQRLATPPSCNPGRRASAAGEHIVGGLEVTNIGSDRGLKRPMLERRRARPGGPSKRYLADGGFGSAEDIEWAHGEGIDIFCPPTQSKHGTDPYCRGAA